MGGAHRALDAAQRVAAEEIFEALDGQQHLIAGRCEALAQGGGLRGHVVGAAGHNQGLVLGGVTSDAGDHGDGLIADDLQRGVDLQLLHVLGEIAAGHALVNVLVAGQRIEFFDAGLHIVAGDALALRDGPEVHVLYHGLVGIDGLGGDVYAQILLGAHDRNPELALQDDFMLRAPDIGQLRGGIAGGQDVGNLLLFSHVAIIPCLPRRGVKG